MLALLASANPEGEVSISRPREGDWPEELHLIRLLEKDECLRRVRLVDGRADGTCTAVYALTPKGARVSAQLRTTDRPSSDGTAPVTSPALTTTSMKSTRGAS